MPLIKDSADAAQRERAAAMPSPVTTARRGITVGRYMQLSEQDAARMVIAASSAAAFSARENGCDDTTWLEAINAEATRVYMRNVQAALPGGTPWDSRNKLRDLDCPECGIPWAQPSPDCPRIVYNLHPLAGRAPLKSCAG